MGGGPSRSLCSGSFCFRSVSGCVCFRPRGPSPVWVSLSGGFPVSGSRSCGFLFSPVFFGLRWFRRFFLFMLSGPKDAPPRVPDRYGGGAEEGKVIHRGCQLRSPPIQYTLLTLYIGVDPSYTVRFKLSFSYGTPNQAGSTFGSSFHEPRFSRKIFFVIYSEKVPPPVRRKTWR